MWTALKGLPCPWLLVALANGWHQQETGRLEDNVVSVLTPCYPLPYCHGFLECKDKATNFQQSVLFIKLPSQLLVTTPSLHLQSQDLKATRHHNVTTLLCPLVVSLDPAHSFIDSTFLKISLKVHILHHTFPARNLTAVINHLFYFRHIILTNTQRKSKKIQDVPSTLNPNVQNTPRT